MTVTVYYSAMQFMLIEGTNGISGSDVSFSIPLLCRMKDALSKEQDIVKQ